MDSSMLVDFGSSIIKQSRAHGCTDCSIYFLIENTVLINNIDLNNKCLISESYKAYLSVNKNGYNGSVVSSFISLRDLENSLLQAILIAESKCVQSEYFLKHINKISEYHIELNK